MEILLFEAETQGTVLSGTDMWAQIYLLAVPP